MLSKECISSTSTMEIENWEQRYMEELGEKFDDNISIWVNGLSEKEYEKELWKHWKAIGWGIETPRTEKNGGGYWDRPAMMKDIKIKKNKRDREEFIEDYVTRALEGGVHYKEYIDMVVDIYQGH